MRRYWDDEDPMTKVGLIRIVVAKHNKSDDIWKKRVSIIHTDIFQLGFVCNPKEKYLAKDWCMEEWDTHDTGVTEYLLQDKPNGLYEIVGDLYHYGWTSGYETPEYESDMDVRNHQIQSISYDHAYWFNKEFFEDEEVHLTKLLDKESRYLDWDTEVHHFMDKLQILKHHANALAGLVSESRYGTRVSCSDMGMDELESFIHMCMLQIDSEAEKNQENNFVHILAIKMDEEVQKTIKIHEEMFSEKSG